MTLAADQLEKLSGRLGQALRAPHLTLATAESCTAGGIAYAVTLTPGSSQWFDRGFVTYTTMSRSNSCSASRRRIYATSAPSANRSRGRWRWGL